MKLAPHLEADLILLDAELQTPLLQRVFGVSAIHPYGWAVLLIFPCLLFLAEEGRKALVRRLGEMSGGRSGKANFAQRTV